ncbi:MAG TPA: SWIM zinc finger domain-containing protein [Candidatus Corynebacterium avicola]|uniref:SWIM zinc finger domain-containing protein n=1 Tax=Candidatus Corynebacterium avicola TaxID=2838527 RepID=A0A9D1RMX6_9CORY|nr:SWIM zinc finger domain-containing protein [Candidatus Corynebacterium avicola]
MDRAYRCGSALAEDGLTLDLAPGLTSEGFTDHPGFFRGFATHPLVLSRGLLTLAEITRTRYFKPVPKDQRDPVLTANGDRLRAECFSACNGLYARLDLLATGFEGGEIGHGTTNVDLGSATVAALAKIPRTGLLHLDVGPEAMTLSTPDRSETEQKVRMPERWVRALGNTASLMRTAEYRFTVGAAAARKALAQVPPASSERMRPVWWRATRGEIRKATHSSPGAVPIAGLNRLSAVKKLALHLESMSVYAGPAVTIIEFGLPDARLTLALTEEIYRGFSGEGSLLEALASPTVEEDADLVAAILAFEPVINVARLGGDTGLPGERVVDALAYLAAGGRVGWDNYEGDRTGMFFHRELPLDPEQVTKDNPRLVAARRLLECGDIEPVTDTPGTYTVTATGGDYYRTSRQRCSCQWYLRYRGLRGPCKHMLAVQLTEEDSGEKQEGQIHE